MVQNENTIIYQGIFALCKGIKRRENEKKIGACKSGRRLFPLLPGVKYAKKSQKAELLFIDDCLSFPTYTRKGGNMFSN